jgi:hypothetical protein
VLPTLQHEPPHPHIVLPQRVAMHEQVLALQTGSVSGQRFPQPPQLAASLVVFTQTPPQSVRPAGHLHAPAEQMNPEPQPTQLGPQCVTSLSVS